MHLYALQTHAENALRFFADTVHGGVNRAEAYHVVALFGFFQNIIVNTLYPIVADRHRQDQTFLNTGLLMPLQKHRQCAVHACAADAVKFLYAVGCFLGNVIGVNMGVDINNLHENRLENWNRDIIAH